MKRSPSSTLACTRDMRTNNQWLNATGSLRFYNLCYNRWRIIPFAYTSTLPAYVGKYRNNKFIFSAFNIVIAWSYWHNLTDIFGHSICDQSVIVRPVSNIITDSHYNTLLNKFFSKCLICSPRPPRERSEAMRAPALGGGPGIIAAWSDA